MTNPNQHRALKAVGISGNPSPYSSKSRTLLLRALSELRAAGAEVELIDLAKLPAGALLGRENDPRVDHAVGAVAGADIVVASSPIARESYSNLLAVFLDLVPRSSLEGKVAVALTTGHGAGELLAPRSGLDALLERMGAVLAGPAVHGSESCFPNGSPEVGLVRQVDHRAAAAIKLAKLEDRSGARIT